MELSRHMSIVLCHIFRHPPPLLPTVADCYFIPMCFEAIGGFPGTIIGHRPWKASPDCNRKSGKVGGLDKEGGGAERYATVLYAFVHSH